jgi:hypothetical protein
MDDIPIGGGNNN